MLSAIPVSTAITLAAQPMDDGAVAAILDQLAGPTWTASDGAQVLRAWSARGETASELAATVRWLLGHATVLPWSGGCLDLCGTGGSNLPRFNVSTTCALILSAAGIPVVKHGNKGSKRPDGSFDLLDALGIPYLLPADALHTLFREVHLCFAFARAMHPVVARIAPARKEAAALGVRRTIFNLAGPLANPARPDRQLIGVPDAATAHIVAEACTRLGVLRAAVVCGHPGIDEISVTGSTHVWDIANGHIHHRIIERIHHPGITHRDLPGGEAGDNAKVLHELLAGTLHGALRDMVVANAAAAMDLWQQRGIEAHSPNLSVADQLIASGAVAAQLERVRTLSRRLAAASDAAR